MREGYKFRNDRMLNIQNNKQGFEVYFYNIKKQTFNCKKG